MRLRLEIFPAATMFPLPFAHSPLVRQVNGFEARKEKYFPITREKNEKQFFKFMFKIIIVLLLSAEEHAKCSNEAHLIAAHGERRINSEFISIQAPQ